MRQLETWLGDLIRLQASLGPLGPEALAATAECLGMSQAPAGEVDPQAQELALSPPWAEAPPGDGAFMTPPEGQHRPRPQNLTALTITRTHRAKGGPRSHPRPIDDFLSRPSPAPFQPLSLFNPHEQRALLSMASAAVDEIGPPDIPRAIDELALVRPLRRVPRRPVITHRHGAQILVDVSESMVPFHDDATDLVRALREIAGRDEVVVERFSHCPLRGTGGGPRRRWMEWTPRTRHCPVIVVTDLGIGPAPLGGSRARVEEWLAFGARARAASLALLMLVPYPPERWPQQLRRELPIAQWDRPCRLNDLLQARERWWRR